MNITLPLFHPAIDDDRILKEIEKDFDNGCQIYVDKHEDSWEHDDETHAFSLYIEYGSDKKYYLIFDVDLDDLEMFANSLLKSIEMLRRDYSEVIKEKIKRGVLV